MSKKYRIFSGLFLGFISGFNLTDINYKEYWENVKKEEMDIEKGLKDGTYPRDQTTKNLLKSSIYIVPTALSLINTTVDYLSLIDGFLTPKNKEP